MNTVVHVRKTILSWRGRLVGFSVCVIALASWSGCAGPSQTVEGLVGTSDSPPAQVQRDVAAPAPEEPDRVEAPETVATRTAGDAENGSVAEAPESELACDLAALEAQWGIRIVGLRLTAAGRMLDFRYRVVDAEKAVPVFSRKEKPLLIHEATGASLVVPNPPKLGPMRTSDRPIVDRNFFILFGNPGGFVKRGSLVSVVVGDFKAEHLTVQ